ncbi:MAG: U32 family peptidase [Lentimicrobiaceae bacterium]|mgnify:FL=1|nr:U32 family peptidase [Lentimicrobiaceae bacterium]MBT3453379.1 U32 family peptidase [Lentimicrobiaceae bacterium]MBT3819266.1 U32 family peptidase [Lentimicrobiaceae bacterium]MBT4061050.1 U32 family peptidase [Lentimicrobiaceae bacterium]MBT4189997.1 U32 family peptidase [Lentimicrobiaceae bacterium]
MTAKDIEIMAPVGSYESLMAAIQGGANSVYFGIGKLNMRSKSSKNFTIDDLVKISDICKENSIRTYITLNTVIYDHELEIMREIVDAAKTSNITAIIASDQSVIQYAYSAGMEIHMSTQANITNIEAVKYYSQFADVMVTARELEIQQVKEITDAIKNQDICGPSGDLVQIEVFAHGALCMAVSGKCYLSLDNLNSSANRGACLQQCRRKYTVTDKETGEQLEIDNEYIMSPKDLNTVALLDRIIDAGVRVLKLEGRGRSPEYVKTIVAVYREAVNACFEGQYNQENIDIWNARLSTVYNRGFWEGYYMGKKFGEWTEDYGNQATQRKMYIGKITNYYNKQGVAEVKIETNDLNVGDEIKILGETTGVYESYIDEIRLNLEPVKTVIKGDVCSIKTSELVRRGDKMYKMMTTAIS